jgi:hypothetical protein
MPASHLHSFAPDFLKPVINNERNFTAAFRFSASQNIPKGTVLGRVTADGKLKIRNGGASDGSQVAVAIAKYDMQVDANGAITLSATGGQSGGWDGEKVPDCEVWLGGVFDTAQIVSFDGTIADELNGRTVGTWFIF